MYAKIDRSNKSQEGCSYWCEVFGLTSYVAATFGLGVTIF